MKNCPNCNFENPDESSFCTNCGAPLNGQPAYQPQYEPAPNPYDHTDDIEEADIRSNKLFAMCCYLLGPVGVIIGLLAARDSRFLRFHIRQSLGFVILNVILSLVMGLLVWTILVPIAGGVLMAILLVVRAAAFVDAARGKAVDAWLLRSFSFLK